ncbi:MAG: hypothetical protein KGZ39_02780 [Simkania sp.]|nr:hypothetical protein [Simkania sp.]
MSTVIEARNTAGKNSAGTVLSSPPRFLRGRSYTRERPASNAGAIPSSMIHGASPQSGVLRRHSITPGSSTSEDPTVRELFTRDVSKKTEVPISSMGIVSQIQVNDLSGATRTLAGLPVPSWMGSKVYPDVPNSALLQLLGSSTVTNAPIGAYFAYQAARSTKTAYRLGDKRGVILGGVDTFTNVAWSSMGASYAGVRATAIGSMIRPTSQGFANASKTFGMVGGILGAILYAGAALYEFLVHPGRIFSKSLASKLAEKKGTHEKVNYLKNRLGLDNQKLMAKACEGKSEAEFQKAALEDLRPMAKRNVQLLGKYHKIETTSGISARKLDDLVVAYFGKENLVEYGKTVLAERLRSKKIQKMSRDLGGPEAFKAVVEAVNKPGATDAEVAQVVLSKIDAHKKERYQRFPVYAVGAITMALMCVFTGGIGAIVLAGIYELVALAELRISVKRMETLKKDPTPPGRYDKVIPMLSSALAVGSVVAGFVLANVFGFGLPALIIGVIIAATWIGTNIYHVRCIGKRKENYMDALLKKRTINLKELDYLCEHLPNKKFKAFIQDNRLIEKLDANEKHKVQGLVNSLEGSGLSYRDKLKQAIKTRYIRLEKDFVDEFWRRAQEAWRPHIV